MDFCDVVLYSCKIYRYFANVHPSLLSYELFVFSFVPLSWLIFRLYYFPFYVLYSSAIEYIYVYSWRQYAYWYFFNLQLFLLMILNVSIPYTPPPLYRWWVTHSVVLFLVVVLVFLDCSYYHPSRDCRSYPRWCARAKRGACEGEKNGLKRHIVL